MNVIVRLYWQHDLDLISLAVHPDFRIGVWMKKAMIAYARGEKLVIPLPSSQPYPAEINNMTTHFVLNPEKEADVINVMNGFRTGFRNSAIKLIFRSYLETPRLDPYFNIEMYEVKSRRRSKTKKASIKQEFLKKPVSERTDVPKPDVIENKIVPEAVKKNVPAPEGKAAAAPESKEKMPEAEIPAMPETENTEDMGFDLFGAVSSMIHQ